MAFILHAKNTWTFMKREVKQAFRQFTFSLFVYLKFLRKQGGVILSRSESEFQKEVKEDLKTMFDGCMVLKTDPTDIQGIPDLLILYRDKWASLECKKSRNAPKRPNQEYYVNKMNHMSFSRFICPENKEEVLNELRDVFESRW